MARRLLPATVPHADAAANAGRAALLVAALAGAPSSCSLATRDLLHQDYRRPGDARVAGTWSTRCAADGVAAVVSGAGPTVLALCADCDVDAAVAAGAGRAGGRADGWTARVDRVA